MSVDGDVYFEVAAFPDVRPAVGQEPRGAPRRRAGRRGRAEARPARLRALEGGEARRAVLGEPVGPGPAGLAHRVLGDGDEVPRRDARHPRRRGGPRSSRTTRARSPSPRRATGKPFARYWVHNGFVNLGARRCRSRSATPSPIEALAAAARSRGAAALPPPDALPEPGGVRGGGHRGHARGRSSGSGSWWMTAGGARPDRTGTVHRTVPSSPRWPRCASGSRRRWTTTSTPRRRSAP